MVGQERIEDRDAIYYPFIHLRNEDWLRSTLLLFPHVLRMTPPGYDMKDSAFVRELSNTKGRRNEPLVGAYRLDSAEAESAGIRLAARFRADVDNKAFREKYGRTATLANYRNESVFHIHKDKFPYDLEQILDRAGLIWVPDQSMGKDWFALHPVIGEIVMSTFAAAVAHARGCDVLADAKRFHRIATTRSEGAIYNTLLGRNKGPKTEQDLEAREIGELVIATTFGDLRTLTASDFAALSKEREALFDFRRVLAERAAEIPPVGDPSERLRRAKEAADQIVADWQAKRETFGRFLKRAFGLDAAEEAKDTATKLLEATIFGAGAGAAGGSLGAAAGGAVLGAAPGFAVGFIYYGVKTWRDLRAEERSAPTRFLSLVKKRGATLAAAGSPGPSIPVRGKVA